MIINLSSNSRIDLSNEPWSEQGLSLAVVGNQGSGKSNMMAVLAEEFHLNQIPFIYYDPDGDAASIQELGRDIIVVGDTNSIDPARRALYPLDMAYNQAPDLVRMVLVDGFSMVVDLTRIEGMPHPLEVFTALCSEHYRQASRLREPCGVFVDEAYSIAPQIGADKLQKASRAILVQVASNGRKRGMVLVTATQRTTRVHKDILALANLRIFGKINWEPDWDKIKNYVPLTFEEMSELKAGQVFLVSDTHIGRTRIRRRKTTDLGKTPAFAARPNRPRPDVSQLNFAFVDDMSEAG